MRAHRPSAKRMVWGVCLFVYAWQYSFALPFMDPSKPTTDTKAELLHKPKVRDEASLPQTDATAALGVQPISVETGPNLDRFSGRSYASQREFALQSADGRFVTSLPFEGPPSKGGPSSEFHCVSDQGNSERLFLHTGTWKDATTFEPFTSAAVALSSSMYHLYVPLRSPSHSTAIPLRMIKMEDGFQFLRICANGSVCGSPIRCQGGQKANDVFKLITLAVPSHIEGLQFRNATSSSTENRSIPGVDLTECLQDEVEGIRLHLPVVDRYIWKVDGGVVSDGFIVAELPPVIHDKFPWRARALSDGVTNPFYTQHVLSSLHHGHYMPKKTLGSVQCTVVLETFPWTGQLTFTEGSAWRKVSGVLQTKRITKCLSSTSGCHVNSHLCKGIRSASRPIACKTMHGGL